MHRPGTNPAQEQRIRPLTARWIKPARSSSGNECGLWRHCSITARHRLIISTGWGAGRCFHRPHFMNKNQRRIRKDLHDHQRLVKQGKENEGYAVKVPRSNYSGINRSDMRVSPDSMTARTF
jgi:hypothetical protein